VQYLDDDNNPIPQLKQSYQLTVEGPAGKIKSVREDYENTIILDVEKLNYLPPTDVTSEDHRTAVTTLLGGRLNAKNPQSDSYLLVTAAEPESAHFRVTRLTEKSVPVKVYDQNGLALQTEKLDPAAVKAFVPEGHPLEAKVTLNRDQQLQAVQQEIKAPAKVVIPNRYKEFPITLKLSKGENLPTDIVRNPRLHYSIADSIVNKYRVVIEDKTQLDEYKNIECRGPRSDLDEYLTAPIHLILPIYEYDLTQPNMESVRALVYYLPEEYGRIEIINKTQMPVKFRLEKIPEE
jgi:hypothetical protein